MTHKGASLCVVKHKLTTQPLCVRLLWCGCYSYYMHEHHPIYRRFFFYLTTPSDSPPSPNSISLGQCNPRCYGNFKVIILPFINIRQSFFDFATNILIKSKKDIGPVAEIFPQQALFVLCCLKSHLYKILDT